MSKFNFIVEEDFRKVLEKDYSELEKCLNNSSPKSVLILSGSIIEALLIDYLLSLDLKELTREKLLKWDLNQSISKSYELGIISEKARNLSDVVRNYRNLIHPGKSIRSNESPTMEDASIAKSLLEIIIREIDKKKQETYGYTADQILYKIENDSTSEVIWHHLIKRLNNYEKEKLILKAIPQRYFELLNEYMSYEEQPPTYILDNMSKFFKIVYNSSSEQTKEKVANNFSRIIKEGIETEVIQSINSFFLSDFLRLVSSEDGIMIKQHLISRLEDGIYVVLTKSLTGISLHLTRDELINFTNILVRYIINPTKLDHLTLAKKLLNDEYLILSNENQEIIQNQLDEKKKYASESTIKVIDDLKEYIKDDLPF